MDISKVTIKEEVLSEKESKELEARYKEEMGRHPDLSPERLYHILYVYHLMRKMMNNSEVSAKVSYEIGRPTKASGVVSIVGKRLMFDDPELFVRAIDLATNFDVCPKTDGTVDFCFTFYGLK